jgi:hypothetical protein
VHGCGWDSGAARERSSALAASVASRYALGADGVGACLYYPLRALRPRPGARTFGLCRTLLGSGVGLEPIRWNLIRCGCGAGT